MPAATVYFYCDDGGESQVLEWLRDLNCRDTRAADACFARIRLLAALGHELRRPHADLLRDGIRELRVRCGRVNYRLLYFFDGQDIAVVAHGLAKEQAIPAADLQRAIERKRRYEQEPEKHRATYDL